MKPKMLNRQILKLGVYQSAVEERLESWKKINFNRRLWEKDPTLWFPKPVPEIVDRLGWLTLPEIMQGELDDLQSFAEEVKEEGVKHVVLLGMGGSSLAPKVFQNTFENAPGYPELIVVDSTHPDFVHAIEDKIDPLQTLFLVSSKSGTTLETLSFFRHFWGRVSQVDSNPGHHFVAITDSDTPLMKLAEERNFKRVFQATSDLGGRYSALTVFGLVPAALIGMKIDHLLSRARIASEKCAFKVPEKKSPCLILGAALGELAKAGRDKVTLITSPSISSFPKWLEQLIAESTGKNGKGIIPIVDEPIISPEFYGNDRFFVYLLLEEENGVELEEHLMAVEAAGHPTVRINLAKKYDIGQEIFRWEMAVAAAGALLEVHPFIQPDVEISKKLARQVMEKGRSLIKPDEEDAETLSLEEPKPLTKALKIWLSQIREGDYVSIHAYLTPTPETTEAIQKIRLTLLKLVRLATIQGYGPSFLHSIGQLYKGGPNTGLFLQLVDEPEKDLPVPETNYSLSGIIQAQALGDYKALKQRGRRVLRVNLKKDVAGGLARLKELIHDQG